MHADDKKNIIFAAILTIAILFGWPYIANRFFPVANPPATVAAGSNQQPDTPAQSTSPALAGQGTVRALGSVLKGSPRVAIDTPSIAGSINLRGGRIDDVVLKKYKESIAKDSPQVRLFTPSGAADAYFAGMGWSGQGIKAPDANTLWTASGNRLTPTTPVTLRWDNGQGLAFQILYTIDSDYMITAAQSVTNHGGQAVAIQPYAYLSRIGLPKEPPSGTLHVGPMGVFNGAADYSISYDLLEGKSPGFFASIFGRGGDTGPRKFATTGGWLGFTDKYWHAAIIPTQTKPVDAEFRAGAGQQFQADFTYRPANVAPGKSLSTTSRIFAGAKETKLLEHYTDADGVQLFDRAIDWGWFRWFEKPIFYLLDWLFKLIGNFGVAIICLTFIVRGAMFPVAQRQFASMAAVRALQPKMKALQEKHKEDKPRLQQEMMELYRTEKVNPFSGCLPIFLQIPIFFALYKVLMLTIEMRHQPFVLWIKDLSEPDPLHILNLFGLLPFTPPSFLGIGLLAVILGITMWLQFRLNPAPMDEMQKQVFAIMPWMMMFIMAPFAAGLLIYWITSNLLTVAQQQFLYSRHPQLKQAAAK